jgi:hypothetical protein
VIFAMKWTSRARYAGVRPPAYTDATRCNGTTLDDLKKNGQALTDPLATLQPREDRDDRGLPVREGGRQGPMDHAKCVDTGARTWTCAASFRSRHRVQTMGFGLQAAAPAASGDDDFRD